MLRVVSVSTNEPLQGTAFAGRFVVSCRHNRSTNLDKKRASTRLLFGRYAHLV